MFFMLFVTFHYFVTLQKPCFVLTTGVVISFKILAIVSFIIQLKLHI